MMIPNIKNSDNKFANEIITLVNGPTVTTPRNCTFTTLRNGPNFPAYVTTPTMPFCSAKLTTTTLKIMKKPIAHFSPLLS
jgi:hypothetical protein